MPGAPNKSVNRSLARYGLFFFTTGTAEYAERLRSAVLATYRTFFCPVIGWLPKPASPAATMKFTAWSLSLSRCLNKTSLVLGADSLRTRSHIVLGHLHARYDAWIYRCSVCSASHNTYKAYCCGMKFNQKSVRCYEGQKPAGRKALCRERC